MNNYKIENTEFVGLRIDKVIPLIDKTLSRSFVVQLIDDKKILINNNIVKPSYKIKLNDIISIDIPPLKELDICAENIPLNVIYEDDELLVVNKPQGMVVHPAHGHYQGTLVNALLAHCQNLSGINGVMRPGIVHRIDKDTSGLIVVSKNDQSHLFLASQLKDHTMHREYYALVKGIIKENEGKIDLPIARSKQNRQKMAIDSINGKPSITYFNVVKRFNNYTLIRCKLKTGRTHQIRVHLSYIGHPVEGDCIYSKSKNNLYSNGQLLHAYKLTFIHPKTKKEMSFECPLPDYFLQIIDNLN